MFCNHIVTDACLKLCLDKSTECECRFTQLDNHR